MTEKKEQLERNVARMLESTLKEPSPAFQERLVRDVLAEVARERRQSVTESWWNKALEFLKQRRLAVAAPAFGVLMLFLVVWFSPLLRRTVGQVSCLYGLVSLQNQTASELVTGVTEVTSGQRVQTQVGSRAQIVLTDQSKLIPDPRTRLQLAQTRHGPRILLEQGNVSVEAAKQPTGKALTIQSSQSKVTVLGTKLQVRLVQKPGGGRQTHVRVLSGQVELESGGQKVLLPAGTEGVADDGLAPTKRSIVPEVNALLHLIDETGNRSRKTGARLGSPAIIDVTSGTLWTVISGNSFSAVQPGIWEIRLRSPAFQGKAYSLDGAAISCEGSGDILRVGPLGSQGMPENIILKLSGLSGLLSSSVEDRYECTLPGSDSDVISLVQFHLPASARVERVSAPVLETANEREKQIITVAASVRLPQIHY